MNSHKLSVGLEIERIRKRAFFLWENRTGKEWWDPVSNWLEAKREEARAAIEATPRPLLPYIVVDQNYLRDQPLIEGLLKRADAEGKHILLPDSGLAEMLKGAKWDYAMKRSLEHLSKSPARVALGQAIGPLMKAEEATGSPAESIVDSGLTTQFQLLLAELYSGAAGTVYATLAAKISDAQRHAETQHFNHTSNKTVVLDLVKGWKHDLKSEELAALRSASTSRSEFIKMMASDSLAKTCAMILQGGGYEKARAERLAILPSISGMLALCLAGLALKWLVAGGYDGADEAKLTNDLIDLDFVLFGVLSGEIHSREKRVQELYKDMSQVAEMRWKRLKELLIPSGDERESG